MSAAPERVPKSGQRSLVVVGAADDEIKVAADTSSTAKLERS